MPRTIPSAGRKSLRFGKRIAYPIRLPEFPAGFLLQYANTIWENFMGQGNAPYLNLAGLGAAADNADAEAIVIFFEAFEFPSPAGIHWRDTARYVGNPLAEIS